MTASAGALGETGERMPRGWTIVIPVKSPALAKTRLAPELDADARAALARAFAADTVAAALATPGVVRVLVVGDDASLAGAAEHVPETAARGLTAAIADGIAAARAGTSADGAGGPDAPVGVLLGDLPALRPEHLGAALDAAARHPLAFVRDADGTGTTLATARAGVELVPRFGPDSAREHAAAGFVELDASGRTAWPTLRRDVDTAAALIGARALGVGPATQAVLASLATG